MPELLIGEEMPASLQPICARLADEGVPVRAIARSLQHTPDAVREVIRSAMASGAIAYKPKEDWPPGAHRDSRAPTWVKDSQVLEQELVYSCVRLFKVTKLQGALLAAIINKTEVTKEMLHLVIESRRSPLKETTDPKMVDVVICNLRKRLKPFNVVINTLWARGYFMEPAERQRVHGMINAYIAGNTTPEDLQRAVTAH